MTDQEPVFSVVLWATDVFATAEFLERVAGLQTEARHPGFAQLRAGSSISAVYGRYGTCPRRPEIR
jgi:hypothetical protein